MSPNQVINRLYLPRSRALVSLSVGISVVERYLILKFPFLASQRAQQAQISTYFNTVQIRIISSLISLIIYLLLYQIVRSLLSCNRTSRNRRIVIIASLAPVNRVSSSIFIKDVVTVNYFPDLQAIGPPNRVNRQLWVNFLFYKLLANNISV